MTCPTTSCTNAGSSRSAANRARGRRCPGSTSAPAGGGGKRRRRRSAVCTPGTWRRTVAASDADVVDVDGQGLLVIGDPPVEPLPDQLKHAYIDLLAAVIVADDE